MQNMAVGSMTAIRGIAIKAWLKYAGYREVTLHDLKSNGVLIMVDVNRFSPSENEELKAGYTAGTTLVELGDPPVTQSAMFGGLQVLHFQMTYPAIGRHSFVPVDDVLTGGESTLWFVEME